ncbi:putative nucleotide-binding alpha-beta plait domain superfamily, RNA-binding domain superfamily [Helianthus anomalus]
MSERRGDMRGRIWAEAHRSGNYKSKSGRPETTFLVYKIPKGVTRTLLWKAFQQHSIVLDAFITKKDIHGKIFGIIWFEDVTDVRDLLLKLNMVQIWAQGLRVVLAKFDRCHHRFEREPLTEEWPELRSGKAKVNTFPESQGMHKPGKSYSGCFESPST